MIKQIFSCSRRF